MTAKTTGPAGYTGTQIALHWIVVVLVLFQLIAGETMSDVYRAIMRAEGEASTTLLSNLHIYAGFAILALAVWRLWLRFTRGAPPLPENEHPALKWVATLTHFGLYAILIAAPISGGVAWYLGFRNAGEVHEIMKPVLIVLIVIHVAGALVQHYWIKSDVLRRMTRPV